MNRLFEELLRFIEFDMRMSHVYQPVMLRALLMQGGKANRSSIARALLNEDRSQLEYYSEITRDMVGKVLSNRGFVKREGQTYELLGHELLTAEQVQQLTAACERKLAEYIERRGQAIWNHRRSSSGYVSGTLRYEVLKRAKFRCELCGISAEERALEVDHIVPRSHGGSDEIINLQETRACQLLLQEARQLLLQDDSSIRGFNIGINSGEAAGQTMGHAHIHLIPRRSGDVANPRGGVRGVIPVKANY